MKQSLFFIILLAVVNAKPQRLRSTRILNGKSALGVEDNVTEESRMLGIDVMQDVGVSKNGISTNEKKNIDSNAKDNLGVLDIVIMPEESGNINANDKMDATEQEADLLLSDIFDYSASPIVRESREEIRPALADVPDDIMIDVERVLVEGDGEEEDPNKTTASNNRPRLRRIQKGDYALQQKFTLKRSKQLPPVPEQRVLPEEIRRHLQAGNRHTNLDGSIPDFLAVITQPDYKKVERNVTKVASNTDLASNIFGEDERQSFCETQYPFSTVGRVETDVSVCTGTMVGPRLMLTAQHCIHNNPDGTSSWMKFVPASCGAEKPFGQAFASRFLYYNKIDETDGITNYEVANDFVLVVLSSKMGDLTGFTGVQAYDPIWNNEYYWDHIGYPGDRDYATSPIFYENTAITSTKLFHSPESYNMGHFTDVFSGQSGGPFWGWWSGENFPRVIGIQSSKALTPSYTTSGDNGAVGGPGLEELILWARTEFP